MIEALITQCAVQDAPPAIVRQIIEIESSTEPLAINVNSKEPVRVSAPKDAAEAGKIAEGYIEQGYTVDLGYMQVNSQHLAKYDMTAEAMFDPCTNIAIGSEIFMRAYRPTKQFYGDTPLALQTALSAYNTGTFHRGFVNGYVERYGDEPRLDAAQTESQSPEEKPENTDPYSSSTSVEINFGAVDF